MKIRIFIILLTFIQFSFILTADKTVTIFIAGDSTAATNKFATYPQTGIAQAFDRYTRNRQRGKARAKQPAAFEKNIVKPIDKTAKMCIIALDWIRVTIPFFQRTILIP